MAQIDSLEKVLKNAKEDTIKIQLLVKLTEKYLFYAKDTEKAKEYAGEALALANRIKDQRSIAYAVDNQGVMERNKGNYLKALEMHLQALQWAKPLNDIRLNIICNNNIGIVYRRMGDYQKALNYHLQALKMAETSKDEENMAVALDNIGNIYLALENYYQGLSFLERSLQIERKHNNREGIAMHLNTIGSIYRDLGNYKEALDYYMEALQTNLAIGNRKGVAICYNDMGMAYRAMGRFERALTHYRMAQKIHLQIGDRLHLAITAINMGEVYRDLKAHRESQLYLQQGLNIARRIGAKNYIKVAYEQLTETYLKMGDYQQAFETYRGAMAYKDSIMSEEKNRSIAQLQSRFDLEKKEEQIRDLEQRNVLQDAILNRQRIIVFALILTLSFIVLLAFVLFRNSRREHRINLVLEKQRNDLIIKNQKIQIQKEELDQLNNVKDRLFSIIAHDLRGPLQSLQGFLRLLNMEGLTKEEIGDLSKQFSSTLDSSIMLLNNLLLWARTQMQGIVVKPAEIDIHYNAEKVFRLFRDNASRKHIALKNKIDPELQVFADEDMLDAILRNLVANAIKFTPADGSITVAAAPLDDETVEVSVTDTGIGISPDDQAKLFRLETQHTTLGTAKEKGTGLGLLICKEFVEKNGGSIRVESEQGKGTAFKFTVKKATAQKEVHDEKV